MTLGDKLREERLAKGLSQAAVADSAGISRRTYISYEQGNTIPKRREAYEKLASALDCDVDELLFFKDAATTSALLGTATALGALAAVLGSAALPMGSLITGATVAATAANSAGKALSKRSNYSQKGDETDPLKYNNDMLLQYEKRQSRFQKIAIGIIYTKLASEGTAFQPGNKNELDTLGGKPDECIKIIGDVETDWWLSFWAKDEQLDKSVIMSADARAAVMISRYATSKYDENRKVTIVVDDEELYESLLKFKNHNSYRGNMSAMLVDSESVSVVKEEYIAEV